MSIRRFKHIKTNIIVYREDHWLVYSDNLNHPQSDEAYSIPKEIIENSNEWEEIIEKDYAKRYIQLRDHSHVLGNNFGAAQSKFDTQAAFISVLKTMLMKN